MKYRIDVPPEMMTPTLIARAREVTQEMRLELSIALSHVASDRHRKRLIACAGALLQGRLNSLVKRPNQRTKASENIQ